MYVFHLYFQHHSETHLLKVAYRIMMECTMLYIVCRTRLGTSVSKSLVHFQLNYASRLFATNNPKQSTHILKENGALVRARALVCSLVQCTSHKKLIYFYIQTPQTFYRVFSLSLSPLPVFFCFVVVYILFATCTWLSNRLLTLTHLRALNIQITHHTIFFVFSFLFLPFFPCAKQYTVLCCYGSCFIVAAFTCEKALYHVSSSHGLCARIFVHVIAVDVVAAATTSIVFCIFHDPFEMKTFLFLTVQSVFLRRKSTHTQRHTQGFQMTRLKRRDRKRQKKCEVDGER